MTKTRRKEIYSKWQRSPKGIYRVIKMGCVAKGKPERLQIGRENFVTWYEQQKKKCYYCGISEQQWRESDDSYAKRYKRLTIDRWDTRGAYKSGNIILACHRCNTIKGDYFNEKEMLKIAKIINKKLNL